MPHSHLVPRLFTNLREGYTGRDFVADAVAGLTVAVVALPLAMALAIASGVPPERGLFTAIIAGFLISALGGSRVQIGGPTGAFVVIVYDVVQRYGYDGLVTATFMAGLLLIALGLARFGRMIKFIPYPVTTGFTAGIAVVIFSSQVKDFLGLAVDTVPSDFLPKWGAYFGALATVSIPTVAVGVASLLGLIAFRRWAPRIPGSILVVIAAAALVKFCDLPVATIGSRFGDIPQSLPVPTWPSISFDLVRELIPAALTIALLAGIESLLSAVVADGMTGERHSSNMELVAQGVANVASVMCGGIPATGAIARTATNVKSGARSPISGMLHGVFLLLFMVALAPYAKLVPLTTLAAILFVVAWNMSHLDHFRRLLRAPGSDTLVLLTAFGLTILVDLTVAVEVGVVLAALLFMKRMSEVSDSLAVTPLFDDEPSREERGIPQPVLDIPPGVEVFRMTGPFFFGVADDVKDVFNRIQRPPRIFILRMRLVPFIDATGLHALEDLVTKCKRHGTKFMISGLQPSVQRALERSGVLAEIGSENVFPNIDAALESAKRIL